MIHALQLAVVRATTLQADTGFDVDVSVGEGVAGGAVSAFLTTLVVGAILIAVAPAYTERLMAAVAEEPVGSMLYGFLALVTLVLLSVVLVVTIVGILVVIPLLLAAYLVWAVGATVAYLAIAERLVGREDGWTKPLVVAAGLNGALLLTGIGGIVSLVVGAAGFGAVIDDYVG